MIRRFLTPDVYMAQGPHLLNYAEEVPGAIPEHIDHCIDKYVGYKRLLNPPSARVQASRLTPRYI